MPESGNGAFFFGGGGGSTSAEGLRAVEKAQFEELADEAVRGSGATAYRHSHGDAREAAQGRGERLVRR